MGFSRQEYWSGLLCPPPGDLPDPGIEPMSPVSPALAGGFFTAPWVVTSSTFQHYLESPIGFPYFGPKKENRKKKKNKKLDLSAPSGSRLVSFCPLPHCSKGRSIPTVLECKASAEGSEDRVL